LFARGLSLFPANTKIMNMWACFEESVGELDKARALHRRALSTDASGPATMHNRVSWAKLEADAGNLDLAREILREGLDRYGSFCAALLLMGTIERRAGDLVLAEAYVRRAQQVRAQAS
jgi:Tfp pilus assembly protein PilF